jgi:hypothetical protein
MSAEHAEEVDGRSGIRFRATAESCAVGNRKIVVVSSRGVVSVVSRMNKRISVRGKATTRPKLLRRYALRQIRRETRRNVSSLASERRLRGTELVLLLSRFSCIDDEIFTGLLVGVVEETMAGEKSPTPQFTFRAALKITRDVGILARAKPAGYTFYAPRKWVADVGGPWPVYLEGIHEEARTRRAIRLGTSARNAHLWHRRVYPKGSGVYISCRGSGIRVEKQL